PETGLPEISLYKRITPRDIQALKQGNELTEKVIRDQRHFQIKNLRKHRAYKNHNTRYRTLLCVPITSSSQTYGVVYIANEVVNSFEDVTIQSIITFAEQAGMALENAHLIKNSIELERYQEQLKIAKEVQTQLLPQQLPYSPELEFAAESENAQEVGGDYFDVVQVNEHLFKLAIGDVSGKGTTAAFYMAEIKGIFHALSQLDLDVRTFVCCANKALAKCIQKGFFVTLTYLHINTQTKQIDMLRAGHCPAFFYRKASDEIQMLRDGTLGLGIVRNDSFGNFLGQGETLHYQPGDFLVLYTDGIVEARDEHGEEFGYERFEQIIARHKAAAASTLASEIVQAAKEFTHSELQDDYTVLVIRFR
ncbi:MAG: GAF domain-containing protein, partial [Bacteroidetes bacterium]